MNRAPLVLALLAAACLLAAPLTDCRIANTRVTETHRPSNGSEGLASDEARQHSGSVRAGDGPLSSAPDVPATLKSVPDVVTLSPKLQVCRVHAGRVVATVPNHQAIRYGTEVNFVTQPVGAGPHFGTIYSAVDGSIGLCFLAVSPLPNPAFIIGAA